MKPEQVDKLICGWSMITAHPFTEEDLNSLVDLISQETEKELVSLKDRNKRIEKALRFAAGYISATPKFETKHPQEVLAWIVECAEE